jgi:Mn2+/Fe2+ NRAMP family transporter
MLVYTVATVAFYLLGASVLHGQGLVPAGHEMVQALSRIYTATLGPWAFYLFLAGAFFVLYSTIFSATASNARVVLDFLQMIHLVRTGDEAHRRFWLRVLVVVMVSLTTSWYLIGGEPVAMVLVGGIAQACMLPIIGFSTLYLRYTHFNPELRPRGWVDAILWLCSVLMLSFAAYTLVSRLRS